MVIVFRCGPCRNIAPFVESLALKYNDIKVLKVNVDRCSDISAIYRVTAMPTFVFLKNGIVIDTVRGADPNALEDTINTHRTNIQPDSKGSNNSISNEIDGSKQDPTNVRSKF